MKTHYDPEADALYVRFAPPGAYVDSQEVAPGIVLDFDAAGQVIAIEVLNVRAREAAGPTLLPPAPSDDSTTSSVTAATIGPEGNLSDIPQPGETEAAFHARMKAQGLRLVQIWVPDTTRPGFAEEAHCACLAVNRSPHAAEDQAFVESISDEDEAAGKA